jgi:two-component system, sporulation sensor kinase A
MALYRHQCEKELKESEERYRLLVELSPEPIAVVCDERIVYANPAAAAVFGAAGVDALIGLAVADFVHPDDLGNFLAWERRLKEDQESRVMVEESVRLGGRLTELEVALAPITYGGRPATQILTREITERPSAPEPLLVDAAG